MYCHQCEQTAKGIACTVKGVCGKDAPTAALQDLLFHATMGVSMYAHRARTLGTTDRDVDVFTMESLFSTVTNVNFDAERIAGLIRRAVEVRAKAKKLYEDACGKSGKTPEALDGPAAFAPAADTADLIRQGEELTLERWPSKYGEDAASLRELIVYGLRGAAAYVDHAHILGEDNPETYATFHEALDMLARDESSVEDLLGWALRVGELNLRAMEGLDRANTGAYGHPEPTQVRVTPVKGRAIVVSGHDLKDLEELLKQTEGKGVNVYTHGEMLPAHAYPELKKYAHLVGNYGGAWQDQAKEFDAFPGAILMTTNCIQKPRDSYTDRIFTTGLVAWPGVRHVTNSDFGPVIEAALAAPGFAEDEPRKEITVGFGRNAVLGVADKVIEAVKAGKIRHFFLVGGCDGAKSGRNYYTEFAKSVPDDCVILTLACGKYRFNKMDFGDIGGIPRLLDVGQCNDAYSAVMIAQALADAFGVGVNDLPLSLVLSWYEQKAVAILLTLLHLGIKGIRLGPSLPAWLSPNVINVLVENFEIAPIGTPQEDLEAILEPQTAQ
jgi:hydroxylamine reductase